MTIRLQGECSTSWAKVAYVRNCPSILWKMHFLSNFFIVIFSFIYFTYTSYTFIYFVSYAMIKKIIIFSLAFIFLQSCALLWGSQKSVYHIPQEASEARKWLQIFALWDSLTAWYWLPLEDSYPSQLQEKLINSWYNIQVINAWVSWNTSSELKGRLDWVLSDARAWDIAILVIWWNDGLRGMGLTDLENNIQEMIDILQSREMHIVLWGMQIPPNLWIKYTQDFENLYKNIAWKNKDIFFIDFFLENVAWVRNLNLPDGIHPTPEGYKIIADRVYTFLTDNILLWSK